MAASQSQSQAVKCLDKSGRKRFVFKSFSRRVGEIDIDVFRSLDPVKAEPKDGSSFFKECLLHWRELNTAEDFISFYEGMMPLVQTLPQILLHRERIFSELLRRLNMKTKLSLEPILMLIAALSRDVLEEFLPLLQRLSNSLVDLLTNGGDRDPEILEQLFTSWSYIIMYLQKYLVKDIVHILKITVHLRYFPKDYVQEFMAEAVSFLLRNSPMTQLKKGIRTIVSEVSKDPSQVRKIGVTALLWHVMRGSSSRLHSRAEKVFELLIDKSVYRISDRFPQGTEAILEVINGVIQRLWEEIDHKELHIIYKCLIAEIHKELNVVSKSVHEEISSCIGDGGFKHMDRLLSLLIDTVHHGNRSKVFDGHTFHELVRLLIQAFIVPTDSMESASCPAEVTDTILQLMLCLLDISSISGDLSSISREYAPAFRLRNSSLLTFIKGLIAKDPHISYGFRSHILSAMNDLVETSPEEVLFLMLTFFKKGQEQSSLDGVSEDKVLRICRFLNETLCYWANLLKDIAQTDHCADVQAVESKLSILWGSLSCYPYFHCLQDNLSSTTNLIGALDGLLEAKLDSISSLPKSTWQSLLGAALTSHHKLLLAGKIGLSETSNFLRLAKKHKSSSQVLSAVAEFLDFVFGDRFTTEADASCTTLHEFGVEEMMVAINGFADNLSLPNKTVRVSTLRILSHYDPLDGSLLTSDERPAKKPKTEEAALCQEHSQCNNVVELLLSIETTPLSISTSRQALIPITRLQMGLAAGKISEGYMPLILNGLIGILHNRFAHLWEPTLECLAVVLAKYKDLTWNRFVWFLDIYQSQLLSSTDPLVKSVSEVLQPNNLGDYFSLFIDPYPDSTPRMTVLVLLLQSLQKISHIAESRSRQLVPMFLKFLGYTDENFVSIDSFSCHTCKGKEWRLVLKEWLNLLKLMRNARSLYRNEILKKVLISRLLDEIDPDIQLKVLDCLLTWKDEFLIPYDQHLKNLIISKNLREELTTWAVSKESQYVQDGHRGRLIPLVIRLLTPKVRKSKALASRKHGCVSHRRAVLAFLVQLDVDELGLFFTLLLKPLHIKPVGTDVHGSEFDSLCGSDTSRIQSSVVNFSASVPIANLSLKKRYGFLHVVEDILKTFDELHLEPFLNSLMRIVGQILENCMLNLTCENSNKFSVDGSVGDLGHDRDKLMSMSSQTTTSIKQYKDLRSLCLKVICFALNKFEGHDYGSDFWDTFFSSVKPLIDSFKQEGSSSEKPSSLLSCFVAMSQSPELVSLLDREAKLVPTIFSLLTVRTASDAIISSVLNFIENLLNLDNDLDHQEHNSIKTVLLPHLGTLIDSFHGLCQLRTEVSRKSTIWPGKAELRILKLLVKYINDPLAAEHFVDILTPFLKKKAIDPDECLEGLNVVKAILPVLGGRTTGKILKIFHPLLVSVGLDLRLCICDILDSLALIDPSLASLAKILHELNAVSSSDVGELDYDTRVNAYDKIRPELFSSLKEDHALTVLSHCLYDMSSEELIFRQSASRSLLSFVQFAVSVLDSDTEDYEKMLSDDGECKDTKNIALQVHNSSTIWTKGSIQKIIKKTFLKNMSEAMSKDISIQKEWIALLRDMVYNLQRVPALNSFRCLCDTDPEVDFFNNILHLQIHRRGKALSRFRACVGSLSEDVTIKIFVPLFYNMLFDVKDGKGEHLRNACLETLASIAGQMRWESYRFFLMRCFQEMARKPDKHKLMVNLICAVLDVFHFSEAASSPVEDDGREDSHCANIKGNLNSTLPTIILESNIPAEIQDYLQKVVLPQIQKLVTSDSDKVNVKVSLALLKLLKLLPAETMESQLPSIIHRICNFLKNRLESIRDEARSALASCAKVLGLEYLHFIVKVLQATLKRGYELHVLGYTLNFILSKTLTQPVVGKLDYCLENLLSIAVNDIFGDVAEEKEVDKIASKMKETRKNKSFETLKLISQSITFRTHAMKLLSPIIVHLQKHLTPKTKSKLERILNHIASGVECNPSTESEELFIFVYGLIEDNITGKDSLGKERLRMNKRPIHEIAEKRLTLGSDEQGLKNHHLIAEFGLGVLHNRLKNMKLDKTDEKLLSMLDPFVKLLGDCLNSKYENILSATFRCLIPLTRLPLPSLEMHADKIKIVVLDIAQRSANGSSLLIQSCLKLLTVLLQSTRISLSQDQLHMLIQFPLFIDLQTNPTPVALSLLKSIIGRKLVVHEIYDVVLRVAELMVTSQLEAIRKNCSQILLQFLLDYHLSDKRLQQHLDFLLTNLSYEHPSGRESVLEMLHAILIKFPTSVVKNHAETFFLHLVVALANEHDQKVRSMVSTVLKELIYRTGPDALNPLLAYTLSWYTGEKQHLWGAAAQVIGFLVEVLKKGFHKHIDDIMKVAKNILEASVEAANSKEVKISNDSAIPFWKEAYYSLVMFETMLQHFPELYKRHEDTWEMIIKLLLHPHKWLRNICSRLVGLHFAAISEACRHDRETFNYEASYLVNPSRLFAVAASCTNQLRAQRADDDATSNLITQNIVFSICRLHSFAKKRNYLPLHEFWSTLDRSEEGSYIWAFESLGSPKAKNTFLLSTNSACWSCQEKDQADQEPNRSFQSLLIVPLLERMGKFAMGMEDIQVRIVFNCFRDISLQINSDSQEYAFNMLLPVYKVCEGFAGKVVGDEIKQLAEEVRDRIRDVIGVDNFVNVYNMIRKKLKVKRDTRRQEQKLIAVINPMRHAKRKLWIAAKHRAHKKRKITSMKTMKTGRWRR